MSAIQAPSKTFNVGKTIDTTQQTVKNSNNVFKINWVKVQVGIQENVDAVDWPSTQH